MLYCVLTINIYESILYCDSAREICGTLYHLDGTDQNVLLSEFVAQDKIMTCGNVRQVDIMKCNNMKVAI